MKTCPRTDCIFQGKEIEESNFWKSKKSKDGLDGWCIDCRKKQYLESKPQYAEHKKLYRERHSEHRKLKAKKWREEYPEKRRSYLDGLKGRYNHYKNCSKTRQINFDLTLEQFDSITKQKCYLCGEFSQGKDFCGIDRVDSNIGYDIGNCMPCCAMCNFMKLDYSKEELIEQCKKIINHLSDETT